MVAVAGFALLKSFKGQLFSPPKALVLTWVGIAMAYVSGIFRGNIAYEIIIYKSLTSPEEQSFHAVQDAIRCFHWLLLISTPWLISQLKLIADDSDPVNTFLKWVRWTIFVSAIAAVLDHWSWIDLSKVYPYPHYNNWWTSRTYGTLPSPLEAGLVYAFGVLSGVIGLKDSVKTTHVLIQKTNLNLTLQIFISAAALIYTQGQVAEICCLVAVAAVLLQDLSMTHKRKFAFLSLILGVTGVSIAIAFGFHLKVEAVAKRTITWAWWIQQVVLFPRILFTGIGFSAVYVDNSSLWVLITGGLALCVPLLMWFDLLLKKVTRDFQPLFLFWVLTWLGLDSLSYWGIGRIMIALVSFYLPKETPAHTLRALSR